MTTNVSTTTILIPTAFRAYAGGHATYDTAAATVGEALAQLAEEHSGLRAHLYGDDGSLRQFVNIYLGEEDIRYLQGPETPLNGWQLRDDRSGYEPAPIHSVRHP